jgi:DNA-binding transcriptional MerR regulator
VTRIAAARLYRGRRIIMNQQNLLLTETARLLGVRPYQITYALSVGLVAEPELRIANKRIFQEADIARLSAHFGRKDGLTRSDGRADAHAQ